MSSEERIISFLLGSGFSVPAGYPTTSVLNQRLGRIDVSEISIHTSGNASFLNGEIDLNAEWMGLDERRFVQEFLEFYCENVLNPQEIFHYETFYDYYSSIYRSEQYPETLVGFLDDFRERSKIKKNNNYLLLDFHNTFNQLIAALLHRRERRVHHAKPYHPNYAKFLLFVEDLAKTHRVNFHTLNHDLYMEYLARSDSINGDMDDGFEEQGSMFYGEFFDEYERYTVRLPRFTGKFDQKFCLYKLHGSIDNYLVQDGDEFDYIKVKRRVSPLRLFKEVMRNGVLCYEDHLVEYFPDFLTGTTSKMTRYGEGIYYPHIFDNFKKNLQSSNTLIVIGYGFTDEKINEYIQNNFLTNESKTLFVVGNSQPSTDLLSRDNVFFMSGGVSGLDGNLIMSKMKP